MLKDRLRHLASLSGPFDEFDTRSAGSDPSSLFEAWLADAIARGLPEAHAMTLSTVDAVGDPDARVVILKDVDAQGWHFATSSSSAKGRQMAAHPRAAMTFYWQPLGRQVRLRGPVTALDREVCAADFLLRSLDARAVALTGRQSDVVRDDETMEGAFDERRLWLQANPETTWDTWAVYALNPLEAEFWQASERRRHVRWRYRRASVEAPWKGERLWP